MISGSTSILPVFGERVVKAYISVLCSNVANKLFVMMSWCFLIPPIVMKKPNSCNPSQLLFFSLLIHFQLVFPTVSNDSVWVISGNQYNSLFQFAISTESFMAWGHSIYLLNRFLCGINITTVKHLKLLSCSNINYCIYDWFHRFFFLLCFFVECQSVSVRDVFYVWFCKSYRIHLTTVTKFHSVLCLTNRFQWHN